MDDKEFFYDLIRASAILIVFLGHFLMFSSYSGSEMDLALRAINPGITMTLLGFLSAILLVKKYKGEFRLKFFISRFTRIYIPLFLCLSFLCAYMFKYVIFDRFQLNIINIHLLYDFLGLTWFLILFKIKSLTPLGFGLWFVTVILIMYITLPLTYRILKHKNGLIRLTVMIAALMLLDLNIYNESGFKVMIAFLIGTYLVANKKLNVLIKNKKEMSVIALATIIISYLAVKQIIPYQTITVLTPLYPISFFSILYILQNSITKTAKVAISFFSKISYEFFILHFYIIGSYFYFLFPDTKNIFSQIITAFTLTLLASYCINIASTKIREKTLDLFKIKS